MSTMKDTWGDRIEFLPGYPDGTVEVVFYGVNTVQSMSFDQKTARKFINKLLKTLEEDM